MSLTDPSLYWESRDEYSGATTVTRGLRPVVEDVTAGTSTILREQFDRVPWLGRAIARLNDLGRSSNFVDPGSVLRCAQLLEALPFAMPQPFLSVGDDGSIGVEWDRRGSHLFISFAHEGDEVYWRGRNGDEWEATRDASHDKLSDALNDLMSE